MTHFIVVVLSSLIAVNAHAWERDPNALLKQFDLPSTEVVLMHIENVIGQPPKREPFKEFHSEEESDCVQQQLAEWQTVVAKVQGGKSAVDAAFKANNIKAHIEFSDSPAGGNVFLMSAGPDKPTLLNFQLGLISAYQNKKICPKAPASAIAAALQRAYPSLRLKITNLPPRVSSKTELLNRYANQSPIDLEMTKGTVTTAGFIQVPISKIETLSEEECVTAQISEYNTARQILKGGGEHIEKVFSEKGITVRLNLIDDSEVDQMPLKGDANLTSIGKFVNGQKKWQFIINTHLFFDQAHGVVTCAKAAAKDFVNAFLQPKELGFEMAKPEDLPPYIRQQYYGQSK